MNVSMRIREEIIFQYAKYFPLYFSPEEEEQILATGIAFEDSIPVIEGEYKMIVLLQNSVGKEFTVFERDVLVSQKPNKPQIVGPFLGYKVEEYKSDLHIPFKFLDKKLAVDPKNTFSFAESINLFFNIERVSLDLWNGGSVDIIINPVDGKTSSPKSYKLAIRNYPHKEILNITQSIPARELAPAYYEMKLFLRDMSGEIIDEKKENFIISPAATISHPTAHMNAVLIADKYLFYYFLAQQYERIKNYENAEINIERAYELKPDNKKGLINYANFLFMIGKYKRSLELIEKIKEDVSLKFNYYLIKGKAYMGLGNYSEAIGNLLEGNKIYNSDISLLNSLAICYYKSNEKKSFGNLESFFEIGSEPD